MTFKTIILTLLSCNSPPMVDCLAQGTPNAKDPVYSPNNTL